MKVISRTEKDTKLENSLRGELGKKFTEKCENNILVFKDVEVKEKGYVREEIVRIELFYDPFSECECFKGRRFNGYIEKFLTLSSLIDGRLELLESYENPAVNKPEDIAKNVSMRKVLEVKGLLQEEDSDP